MEIKQYDYQREYERYADEYDRKALEVLHSGWYTLGKELASFEREWADYLGAKYCVGLASGLDALWIAFRMLGIGKGNEVIVQANTYIASVMGITINGATPVFVEPDEYYGIDADRIEEKITERTKAVLVVHLYGMPCQMDRIVEICQRHHLRLVEDCAQSHAASFRGKMTGTFGDIGCFSFFPSKTLGAFGDAGGIVTDDEELAEKIRVFRNYGSYQRYHFRVVGANSRLDELQAGLLRVKLRHLDEIVAERVRLTEQYTSGIHNPRVEKPVTRDGAKSTWHQYVIRCKERDGIQEHLKKHGIDTYIHYPIPPHLSEAYSYMGYLENSFPIAETYSKSVLSLPLYVGMEDEQGRVIEAINEF